MRLREDGPMFKTFTTPEEKMPKRKRAGEKRTRDAKTTEMIDPIVCMY
jgi:hypothetical protein